MKSGDEEVIAKQRGFFNLGWEIYLIAIVYFVFICLTAFNFGVFRDEFYYIVCGENLDFGYVDHPPLAPFIAAISTTLFGKTLFFYRFWVAAALFFSILFAANLSRDMGGNRTGQLLSVVAFVSATGIIGIFGFFSMNGFDVLFWLILAWLLTRLLCGASPRLWLVFGLVAGLGLQNKISILYFGAALVVGLLLSDGRKQLLQKWMYFGGAIAVIVFLPHIIWQILHGWPTLEFIHNAQTEKALSVSPMQFISILWISLNPLTVIFWAAGLWYLLFGPKARQLRTIGFMIITVVGIILFAQAKNYYTWPALGLLLIAGGVQWQLWLSGLQKRWIAPIGISIFMVISLLFLPTAIPLLPADTTIDYLEILGMNETLKNENKKMGALPQHFADRFGWQEMVKTVAAAFNTLEPEEQKRTVIVTSNYGEAGALDYYGHMYGLPKAVSGHNNYYYWGLRDQTAEIFVLYNVHPGEPGEYFSSIVAAEQFVHPWVMPYENNVTVYICRELLTKSKNALEFLRKFE